MAVTVTRLIRISYGDYQLQNIPRGAAVEVPVKSLSEHHRHRGPLFLPRRRPTAAAGVTRQTAEAATPPIQWVRHAAVGV